MVELALSQRVSLAEDVLLQELAGEAVLLNLDTESYFGLDEVGTSMLQALAAAPSIAAAQQQLLNEYEVTPEALQRDLLALIEQLVAHGLVRVTAA
ncbi:MAG: PqqD family protein [Spirulinaceae cyanobacterium SM2_1_0]|nr:PqqD family protein [Spirulinaceae cyanobacterium SM2_1_0]